MNYPEEIAKIIRNFRRGELSKELDAAHVCRWVSQFDEADREMILAETYRVLSHYYFSEEKIFGYVDWVLSCLEKETSLRDCIYLAVQEKGSSQKLLLNRVGDIYEMKGIPYSETDCKHELSAGTYVYIDDGSFSGRRMTDDLMPVISKMSSDSRLFVFHMIVFQNGYVYCKEKLIEKAQRSVISVCFKFGRMLLDRKELSAERVDTVWPYAASQNIPCIKEYERKLRQSGKQLYYLYCSYGREYRSGLFSSAEAARRMAIAFLQKGIEICNSSPNISFLPLGKSAVPGFGFGAFCATDWNIPNNCPLALWWGDIEDPAGFPGNWYPLLPRRNNKAFLDEEIANERVLSVAAYRDVFLKIHRIVKTIPLPRNDSIQTIAEDLEDFDVKSVLEEVQNGKLYPYICTLAEREIAAVQAVFYLGRDYIAPEPTEEEITQWIDQLAEVPDAECPPRTLCVDNPDAVLRWWIDDVRYGTPWQGREEEIQTICYKEEVFRTNWERGLQILGIKN